MSRPIHETLSARFPGAHMVFDAQADCQLVVPLAPVIASRGGTPLLTDRRTAQAMNVPYTVLQGAIVVIQPRDARAAPGVTVVPAEALGAALPSRGTVITELREPPMTIVQSANGVTVSESVQR